MTLDLSSEPQRPKKWHSIFLNTRKKQNCLQGILYPVKLLFKNVLLTWMRSDIKEMGDPLTNL